MVAGRRSKFRNDGELGGSVNDLMTRKRGFALSGLILGIVAFVLGLLPIVGFFIGAAGIALSIVALVKRQSKAMGITGLVLASIATLTSIVTTLAIIISSTQATIESGKSESSSSSPIVWSGAGGETVTDAAGLTGDYVLELETQGECFYSGLLKRDKIDTISMVSATTAGSQQFNIEALDGEYYFVMTTGEDSACTWTVTLTPGRMTNPTTEPAPPAPTTPSVNWFDAGGGFEYDQDAKWEPCEAGQCIQIRIKTYTFCTHGIEMGILPMKANGSSLDGVTSTLPEGLETGQQATLSFSIPGSEATGWLPYDITCYP